MTTTVNVTQMCSYGGSIDTSQPSAPAESWDSVTGKPNFSSVAMSGSYADLSNKPTMFSGAYSELTGLPVLFSGAYADLTGLPVLFNGTWSALIGKPVLFSGSYADLTNKPTSFPSSWVDVSGKPALFSGSYSDLSGKPTLFSGSYTDLTNKPASTPTAWADITGKPSFFSGTYSDLAGKPDQEQRIRVQTSATGSYTWTFPVPYASGVKPVISGFVEDASPNVMWAHQITSLNNISVTIQLVKSAPIVVAGISVLGASVNTQAFIHLKAISP